MVLTEAPVEVQPSGTTPSGSRECQKSVAACATASSHSCGTSRPASLKSAARPARSAMVSLWARLETKSAPSLRNSSHAPSSTR